MSPSPASMEPCDAAADPATAVPAGGLDLVSGRSLAGDPSAPYARLAVVGLLLRLDTSGRGHWLLLHRRRPVEAWDPPGGRMERREDLRPAVVREVAEETGLAVRVAGPCYAYLTVYEGERLLAVSMACQVDGDPEQVRLEAGGADAWRWVTADEWTELAASGQSTWRVDDVRKATHAATAVWEEE